MSSVRAYMVGWMRLISGAQLTLVKAQEENGSPWLPFSFTLHQLWKYE